MRFSGFFLSLYRRRGRNTSTRETAPVLVASFDENGRFLGLAVVTQPSEEPVEAGEEVDSIKIFWIDKDDAPKGEGDEIVRMTD